jgi:hypothetical protein
MSTIRIPRKKQENREQPPVAKDEEIRAERAEDAEFENARESEELPEHYRTTIDKY